jgi:uncharacterized membrane protein YidH (DUF202 family)
MKLEPKTFFANERTFLAWLHMAITLGSIAAALLGFSAGEGGSSAEEVCRRVAAMQLTLTPNHLTTYDIVSKLQQPGTVHCCCCFHSCL